MKKIVVTGVTQIKGSVDISGSKNACLPILAGCLLAEEPVTLTNVPQLEDITTITDILKGMGAKCERSGDKAVLDCSKLDSLTAPYELVRTMRASVLALGPLLARFGEAHVAFPGGCAIGSRPVDLHLKGFEALGARIEVDEGYIHAYADSGRLKGGTIVLETVTVGGTQNILMAAVLAEGQTVIENAAKEPEIDDLANFLNAMGAKISGIGSANLVIEGVPSLGGCEYAVMSDRIEAGTFLVAAAATRGSVTINKTRTDILDAVLQKLREAGAEISIGENSISLDMQGKRPLAVDIKTAPYPAFPTDMQAQFTALISLAEGRSMIVEDVFENRLMHVPEMKRMGANIKIEGRSAIIEGIEQLNAAPVEATDLRASASMVICAMMAEGETHMEGIHHMDRGYERIEEKLTQLGANIKRVTV